MNIIKDLGTKIVGSRKYRFALIECPQCKVISERRVRNDCSPLCRKCAVKNGGKKKSANSKSLGDNNKASQYHRLYTIWRGMIRRCHDKSIKGYTNYGLNGVTVCLEWRNSYASFKEWSMKNGYNNNLVIDKDYLCELSDISPKIYSPQTCQWITVAENYKLTRRLSEEQSIECAKLIENNIATPTELADKYGVKRNTILTRSFPYRKFKYKKYE